MMHNKIITIFDIKKNNSICCTQNYLKAKKPLFQFLQKTKIPLNRFNKK
jgi:hypothetical protein